MAWNPFGVSLELTATGGTVTRTSATQFTVKINASWETYYSGAQTIYGMTASSGGSSVVLNKFGTKASSGSGSFTGTYSISGYGSATKTITVTFRNYNDDNGDSATKNVTFSVSVPAWSSYTIKYNANGGTGAPSSQTKYRDVNLTLSSTKPTRVGYTFQGWSLTQGGSVYYAAGATCGKNENLTLWAVWKANTYTVTFNANGGSLGSIPSTQTKTYGVTLTLPTAKPTRTDYIFKGWGTSASATTVSYSAGGSYTKNAAITLYAIWAIGYTKPRITNVEVGRVKTQSDGSWVYDDEGTYVQLSFDWETDNTVTAIYIDDKKQTESSWTEMTTSASGKSGSVSLPIRSKGTEAFDTEYAYQIRIRVTDGVSDASDASKTTTVIRTIPSLVLPIDVHAGGDGVSFGKTSTTANLTASAWSVGVGNKEKYGDPNTGVLIHKEGYIHLQRNSTGGKPYIGFLVDDDCSDSSGNLKTRANIRYNKDADRLEFIDAGGYEFGNDLYLPTKKIIYGDSPASEGGALIEKALIDNNSSGTLKIGSGNYSAGFGDTYLMGNNVLIWVKTAGSSGTYFAPYYRKGESISIAIATAGYVTNGSKDVSFIVPLSKPIIGSPTITAASNGGFTLRQGTKYTHGSSATVAVAPSTYSASLAPGGVRITASFTNITNVTNNDAIGINWSGTITFS